MVSTRPGSSPAVVRDAHYHPIAASATWAAFRAAMLGAATASAAEREHEDTDEERATTYARGTLGGH